MLDTAIDLLGPEGLTVSLDHLDFEELIRQAGVPRSSAYKEFGDKNGLITSLLLRMIDMDSSRGAAFSPGTLEVAERVIRDNAHLLGDVDGQERVLREAIRLGALQNYRDILRSTEWRTGVALSVSLSGLDEGRREEVLDALRTVESRFIDTMSAFYEQMLQPLGRRIAPGVTAQQIAAAGSAVVEGVAQRSFVNPDLVEARIMLPALSGEPVEWHLSAVGFLAIIEQMTERI